MQRNRKKKHSTYAELNLQSIDLCDGDGITDPMGYSDSNGLTNGNEIIDMGPPNQNGYRGNSKSTQFLFKGTPIDREHVSFYPFWTRYAFELGYRKRFSTKLLASLTIVLLIFSAIIILGNTSSNPGIVIDGRFSDWKSTEIFQDEVSNSYPDIISCGIRSDDIFLSFYLQTAESLLSGFGSTGDTLRIFIDTDSNANTGYSIKTIGSDFLVEIYGVDNTITSSWYYQYDLNYRSQEPRSNHDWNAWSPMFSVDAAVEGNEMEAQIWMDEISMDGDADEHPRVLFHLSTAYGKEDASTIVSERGGIRISTTSLITSSTLLPERSYPVLELEIKKIGASGLSINSISFILYSTLHDNEIASSELHSDASAVDFCANIEGGRLFFTTEEDLTDSVVSEWRYTLSITLARTVTNGHALVIGLSNIETTVDITPSHLELAQAYAVSIPENPVIDGIFSEWDDPLSDSNLDCSDNSINIVSFDSMQFNGNAYFYTEVESNMLAGGSILSANVMKLPQSRHISRDQFSVPSTFQTELPLPIDTGEDTLFIFLDTDPSKGYESYPDHFSDLMIEIQGRSNKVISALQYSFTGNSSTDWSWSSLGNVSCAITGDGIEIGIPMDTPFTPHFHMVSWDGNQDRGISQIENDKKNYSVNSQGTRGDETDVCLNEIFPNPELETQEWAELYNPTENGIDLENWILTDESGTIWTGGVGEEIVLGGVFQISLNNKLKNTGEWLMLKDDLGITRDEVTYPTYSSYEGLSYARIHDGSEYFERDPTPTGGKINAQSGVITLNEIYYDVTGTEPEGEFIELYNNGTSSITVTGWSLRNDDRTPFDFTTTINSEDFFAIDSEDTDLDSQSYTDCFGIYGLAGSEDFVVLENADGQAIDRITYASSVTSDYFDDGGTSVAYALSASDVDEGNTLGRYPDGTDSDDESQDFQECTASKGLTNTRIVEYAHAILPISFIMVTFGVVRKKPFQKRRRTKRLRKMKDRTPWR